jgi:copper chaperone CopZ
MTNSIATYTVELVTCDGCINKVTKAVANVRGVVDVDVDVSSGTLEVTGAVDERAIRNAVAGAGYRIAR